MEMAAELPVLLSFILEIPESLFVLELVFGGQLFLLTYLQEVQTDWSQKLILTAVASIVTLGLFVTFNNYRIEQKYCWRFLNVVSHLLLFTAYCSIFFMYMPTTDIGTNEDAKYAKMQCGAPFGACSPFI